MWRTSCHRLAATLVGPCEYHHPLRRIARHHALAGLFRPVERNYPNGRFRLLLNFVLGLARAVPVGPNEPGLLDQLLELVVVVRSPHVGVAERPGPVEETLLDFPEQGIDSFGGTLQRDIHDLVLLSVPVASGQDTGFL